MTEAGGVFLWRLKSLHSEGDRSMSIRTACIVLLQQSKIYKQMWLVKGWFWVWNLVFLRTGHLRPLAPSLSICSEYSEAKRLNWSRSLFCMGWRRNSLWAGSWRNLDNFSLADVNMLNDGPLWAPKWRRPALISRPGYKKKNEIKLRKELGLISSYNPIAQFLHTKAIGILGLVAQVLPGSFQKLLEFFLFSSSIVLVRIVCFKFLNAIYCRCACGTKTKVVLISFFLPPRFSHSRNTPSRSIFLVPITLFIVGFTAIVISIKAGIRLGSADTTATDLFANKNNKRNRCNQNQKTNS